MPKRKPEVTLRTAGGILYKVTRRKVKNLNIRVHPDGTVRLHDFLLTDRLHRAKLQPT